MSLCETRERLTLNLRWLGMFLIIHIAGADDHQTNAETEGYYNILSCYLYQRDGYYSKCHVAWGKRQLPLHKCKNLKYEEQPEATEYVKGGNCLGSDKWRGRWFTFINIEFRHGNTVGGKSWRMNLQRAKSE